MKENPIAEIDFIEVAKIAAAISTPGFTAKQKIKEAYELLGLAKHWQTEALKEGINPSLLIYYRENGIDPEEEEIYKPHPLHEEARSAYMQIDENCNPLPVDYKVGLARIIPEAKPAVREARLIRFLKERDKQSKVEEYKKQGFPWSDFENCYVSYRLWWAQVKRGLKSKAGKSKKKKDGKPLRRNDRRKGARAGNFFEKIKKTT